MSETPPQLGELIRWRREALGLSQDQLAERIGTSRAYVSQIESGARKWPKTYVRALSRELELPEDALRIAAGRTGPTRYRQLAPVESALETELKTELLGPIERAWLHDKFAQLNDRSDISSMIAKLTFHQRRLIHIYVNLAMGSEHLALFPIPGDVEPTAVNMLTAVEMLQPTTPQSREFALLEQITRSLLETNIRAIVEAARHSRSAADAGDDGADSHRPRTEQTD